MKKHILISTLVAVVAAIVVPRDLKEASHLLAKVAVTIASFSVELLEYDGYDPGIVESGEDQAPQQDASYRDSFHPELAEWRFLGGRRMPEGLGCWTTHCDEPYFDYENGRRIRRCYWRCPRPEPPERHYVPPPPPELKPKYVPRPPRVEPPVFQTASANRTPNMLFGVIVAVFAVVVAAAVMRSFGSGSTHHLDKAMNRALRDAAEAAAARAKLVDAARHADEVIKRQAKQAFERGRKGGAKS